MPGPRTILPVYYSTVKYLPRVRLLPFGTVGCSIDEGIRIIMGRRPPVPPEPPKAVTRAVSKGITVTPRIGNPVLRNYLRDNMRSGAWKLLLVHYCIVLLLGIGFLPLVTDTAPSQPVTVLTLIGAYCFLISTIIVPLLARNFFPPLQTSDPSTGSVPIGRFHETDARTTGILIISALAALPLLPVFLLYNPLTGSGLDPFDVLPFFQAIVTAVWVNFIMEISTSRKGRGPAYTGRLAVVAMFIFLHVMIVGLMIPNSWHIIQNFQIFKFIMDVNPFSQLYILITGETADRLMVNTAFQRHIDYRLYLFILTVLVLMVAAGLHRIIRSSGSRPDG